jgi:hypothetical protein
VRSDKKAERFGGCECDSVSCVMSCTRRAELVSFVSCDGWRGWALDASSPPDSFLRQGSW